MMRALFSNLFFVEVPSDLSLTGKTGEPVISLLLFFFGISVL